jgi:hypothetical protein
MRSSSGACSADCDAFVQQQHLDTERAEIGLEKDYKVEATSSPSGVTHVTFTR